MPYHPQPLSQRTDEKDVPHAGVGERPDKRLDDGVAPLEASLVQKRDALPRGLRSIRPRLEQRQHTLGVTLARRHVEGRRPPIPRFIRVGAGPKQQFDHVRAAILGRDEERRRLLIFVRR